MSGQRSLFAGGAASAGASVETAAPSMSSPRRAAKKGAAGDGVGASVESAAGSGSSPRRGSESAGRVVGRGGDQGADVGPGLPPGWRRVGACLYLPGGLTVARRTAYDGRWQALRWEGGGAALVCEGSSEEVVLAELARRGLCG